MTTTEQPPIPEKASEKAPAKASAERPARSRARRALRWVAWAAAIAAVLLAAPVVWVQVASAGHRHEEAGAPDAPVVIVFGAELAPGGTRPKPFLAGRLDVAAELYGDGKAKAVLISGDAAGASGDEVAAMTVYLVAHGVPAERIVADGHGLDTYDTCARARQTYGITRALLVSQSFHLPRAVTLCRSLGVDADGVAAKCESCREITLWKNSARELFAYPKAAADVARDRPPAVESPPDESVTTAVRS
jgi:vancomycin permeability regulator SanA